MKHLKTGLAMLILLGMSTSVQAQAVPAQAFTRVTVHLADGSSIPKASIVWRNGVIEAVGARVTIPFDALVTDGGDSLHVYPGFIDGLATWGTPEVPRPSPSDRVARPAEPGYERAGIQPERSVQPLLKSDAAEFNLARNNGFTLGAIAPQGFMLPGQLSIFHVKGNETSTSLFRSNIGPKATLAGTRGAYPGTPMAVMSRYRQLMHDARTLQVVQATGAANAGRDAVLESLYPVANKTTPLYFIADDKESINRVFSLVDELGFNVVLVSGKQAHSVSAELVRRKIPVLVNIDMPARPDSASTDNEERLAWNTRQQAAWSAQVRNIRTLLDAGVRVGFASNGLKPADIRKNLDLLVSDGGLTEAEVIKLLSSETASILGVGTVAGDIRTGRLADLVVTTNPFPSKGSRIVYTVTAGIQTEIKSSPAGGSGGQRGRMPR